jgi:hypothetical protein
MSSAAIAAALLGLPLVSVSTAQADASSQWPLQDLKASQVWSITKGSGTTVAVLDTGVAPLPDTQGTLLSGANFGVSTTSSGNGQTDLVGHGTAMAAIIGGSGSSVTEGFAPSAKILPVIINGTALGNQPKQMAAAIEYAVSQHVSVINLSQSVGQDASVSVAIQDALNSNIVVVAASGDEAASSVDYPAAYPGVIAVGAVDQSGSIWNKSNTGAQVTLAAPGVNVPTEDNVGQAATTDGTSASTAYVSAAVALVRAEHPSWTVGQVIRDLIATADPGSGQAAGQHSDQYGYGIVDPLKALQASAPGETSNPLLAAASSSASAGAATATATSGSGAAASSKSSSGVMIGIIVAVVVVLLIIVLIVVLSRRNRNRPGGGGPGAGGGGGQYPQQNPYGQQANPYAQQNPQGGGPYGQPQQQYPQGGGAYGQPPQQYPYPPQNPQNPQQGQPPQR